MHTASGGRDTTTGRPGRRKEPQITDNYGEVSERVAQVLLGDPQQSLQWTFAAGRHDAYERTVSCGIQ